jgi:transposase-like protein
MERAVRLVFESGRPIAHVAADLGIRPEALRKRVRRAETDAGRRTDRTRLPILVHAVHFPGGGGKPKIT